MHFDLPPFRKDPVPWGALVMIRDQKIKKSLNPMDSRIAPSLLHPLSAKVAKVVFVEAGFLTLPRLKLTFPSRLSGTVVVSAKYFCVS